MRQNIELIEFKLKTSQESLLVYAYNVYLSQPEIILSEKIFLDGYVGQTSQRLQDRTRQSLPNIWNTIGQEQKQSERQGKLANSIPHCDSEIRNRLEVTQPKMCISQKGRSTFYSF